MRVITKFVAAAALAAATIAAAGPASAVPTTFASQNPTGSQHTLKWIQGANQIGGEIMTVANLADTTVSGVEVEFDFLLAPLIALGLQDLEAEFTFYGQSNQVANCGTTCDQGGINGFFSYTYVGSDVFFVGPGNQITTGANLLSGTFTNAYIQGGGASGSVNATETNPMVIGTVDAQSDVVNFGAPFIFNFAFALDSATQYPNTAQTPGIGANCTPVTVPGFPFPLNSCGSLRTFTASNAGLFSADSVEVPPVPEPNTWALMILGFGGAGALLRSRRRAKPVLA